MTIHESQVGRPVETKPDSQFPVSGAYLGPFPWGDALREMARIIEAYLDQPKAMLLREGGQPGEVAPGFRKAETALNRFGGVFNQVLRSFFLAAGKRTLFRINL
jgi:hypothetical protein